MSHNERIDKETILNGLVAIVDDMTADWDRELDEKLGLDTRLIHDLEFESIDVVQLAVAIEEHFQRPHLPFEKLLMKDGRYVDEIILDDAVEFLYEHMNSPSG